MRARQIKAKILNNEQVAQHAYRMILSAPLIAKSAKPGQFIMARCIDVYQPLLRRPFSIHGLTGSNIEILYEVLGEGTKILSQKKPRETLDIIGPLGNGFCLEPGTRNLRPILVAGGIGITPLLFLAQKLSKQKPVVLIGAKTKSEILCEKEFKSLGCEIKIATDDGSEGYKGFVTELLLRVIARRSPSLSLRINSATTKQSPRIIQGDCFASLRSARNDVSIYACGPKPMLKEISKIAKQHKTPCHVSLEAHMACGIGACLGCVVKTQNALACRDNKPGQAKRKAQNGFVYKRVCKDGPVFNADEIIWE